MRKKHVSVRSVTAKYGREGRQIGTVLRFATLLTITAGSWLGGALVERLLSLALD